MKTTFIAEDVLLIIFSYIPDIIPFQTLSLVCQDWYKIIQKKDIWKTLFLNHYPYTLYDYSTKEIEDFDYETEFKRYQRIKNKILNQELSTLYKTLKILKSDKFNFDDEEDKISTYTIEAELTNSQGKKIQIYYFAKQWDHCGWYEKFGSFVRFKFNDISYDFNSIYISSTNWLVGFLKKVVEILELKESTWVELFQFLYTFLPLEDKETSFSDHFKEISLDFQHPNAYFITGSGGYKDDVDFIQIHPKV